MKQMNAYLPVVAGELGWDRKSMTISADIKGRFTLTAKMSMKPTEKTFAWMAFSATGIASGLFVGDFSIAEDAAQDIARQFYDVELLDGNTAFVARPLSPMWMVEGKDK